jgi:DNA-3-methyladenine glycosylase II
MQRLKGIGPFYASLITIRSVGFTDVLPADEPMLLELVALHYRIDGPVTRDQVTDIAEAWRPYRTWASVLVRAASARIGVVGAGRRAG